MASNTTVNGIILGVSLVGEYDKRLVILTSELGRITVFAKGARRQNSALLAICQPFTYATFELFATKEYYHLQNATNIKYFSSIRNDFDLIYYATYFCELAEFFSRENSDDKELLKLLYKSLLALNSGRFRKSLVAAIFEWKAYYLNGVGANIFECAICKKRGENAFFSAIKGSTYCKECAKKLRNEEEIYANLILLKDSTKYALEYIAKTSINTLFDFNVTEEVLEELLKVVKSYRNVQLDRRLNSLESIKEMNIDDNGLFLF